MTEIPSEVLSETTDTPQGAVVNLTVCNPRRLNVLDSVLTHALRAEFEKAAARQARVVVVQGTGNRSWVGGADIREMAILEPETARTFIGLLHTLFRAVREHPAVVIALIDGYCLGAGLELAACCDMRIATRSSSFGMPEVQVGIPSVIEAALLPRLIGAGRAADLVYTGRLIDATTARDWGLVELGDDSEHAGQLAQERTAQVLNAGPQAVRQQKRLCRAWQEQPLTDAIESGIDSFSAAFATQEPHDYMRRFLHRRAR
jgi:enoyl-CoA hydratase/carnithine racemase